MKKLAFLIFLIGTLGFKSHAVINLTHESPGEPEVYQREYLLTNLQSHKAIQTYGLYTCVAVVIYSPTKQKALLAHIDSQTNLNKSFKLFTKEFDLKKSKIYVFGGQPSDSSKLFDKLITQLKNLKAPIYYAERNKPGRDMAIRLDLSNGEVSFYNESISNTSLEVLTAKSKRIRYGDRLYRHIESLGGGDQLPTTTPEVF